MSDKGSRAQSGIMVKGSQRSVVSFPRKVAIIVAIFIAVFIVYSLFTKKDPDVKIGDTIIKQQARKATEEDLGPYRKRIDQLKKDSNSRRLSETELKELEFLLAKTGEVKKEIQKKYILPSEKFSATQNVAYHIYPNYDFPNGVDQIKVPLIPINYRLSRQAGGWVIVPQGSQFRFDHDVPITIENVDGRRIYVRPADVAWIGVEPGNGLLRFYGEEGKFATVSIKRDFYK